MAGVCSLFNEIYLVLESYLAYAISKIFKKKLELILTIISVLKERIKK